MLTASNLQQIMPNIPQDKFDMYLMILNRVMQEDEIDTPLRASAFLAQLAHESGQLKFMEEIWGPTAAQKRYEPPSTLATKLGNTQPGDGKRFKGRGPIQVTGRTNYKRYGDLLGVDLIRNPDLAATPQIGFQIAGTYWKINGLNELADVEDFITITRRINGGLNGLQDRQKYYDIAKNVLGAASGSDDFTIASANVGDSRTRTVRSTPGLSLTDTTKTQSTLPQLELPRGYEAILEDQNSSPTDFTSLHDTEVKKNLFARLLDLIKNLFRKNQ